MTNQMMQSKRLVWFALASPDKQTPTGGVVLGLSLSWIHLADSALRSRFPPQSFIYSRYGFFQISARR